MPNNAEVLTIDQLEDLKALIEAGMQEEAQKQFCELAHKLEQDRNQEVFEQVGELTRNIHDAVEEFAYDGRLNDIAQVEMPRATERLSSIIEMTASAANKTLDAVDACDPLVKELQGSIEQLLPTWNELMKGKIDRDNFVALCKNVDSLIKETKHKSEKLCDQMNIILMAQDYQDITGQMIQKVIKLVAEVEDKLVSFLMNFKKDEINTIQQKDESIEGLAPQGPALESVKSSDQIANSQDDVDDLLASLGF